MKEHQVIVTKGTLLLMIYQFQMVNVFNHRQHVLLRMIIVDSQMTIKMYNLHGQEAQKQLLHLVCIFLIICIINGLITI